MEALVDRFALYLQGPLGDLVLAVEAVEDILVAMRDVFPWMRHLRDDEVRDFTRELMEALSDASELSIDSAAAWEVVEGWRATARIKADPELYRQAMTPTEGDHGRVEIET
jgi:hypothetical protein